jgi:lipopolysaccharide export LptBFGC system permease protein LptF
VHTTLERLVDPTLADLHAEYEEADRDARTWRRRWVWVAGHLALLRLIAACGAARLTGLGHDVTDEEHRPVFTAVVVGALVMLAGTLLLVVPLLDYVPTGHPRVAHMVLYLIPQALPLSLPVGLTFGILWGFGRVTASPSSHRSRLVILALALAGSVVSFTLLAWVVPAANQAFRIAVVGHDVTKGIHELDLGELRGGGAGHDARLVVLEYHKRWAHSAAPMTLAVFAVAFARRRRARLALLAAGCLTILAYYATMVSTETAGRHQAISAVTAAWAPNLVAWTSSFALFLYRRRPTRTQAIRPAQ